MPIFRYHCPQCSKDFELLLARFDSEAECPLCGSSDLEKLPSLIASVKSGKNFCSIREQCPSAGHCCSGKCGCGKI